MDRSVKWILVLAVVLVGACGSATPSVAPTDAPPVSGSAAPEAIPSGATNATVPAIVGEWVGVHDCARIVAMLNEAGLEESLVDAIYGNELVPGVDPATAELVDPAKPCEGAVERAHSHFFTVDGRFGSKDFRGQLVDDGTYTLEGDDVVVIGDQRFHYEINGDELILVPPDVDISGCTTQECRFAATWVLMVAMPGTTWKRGEIRGS